MIAAYAIVITLMIVGKSCQISHSSVILHFYFLAGRVHYLRESDGVCIIGLQRYSSFTLLSYDL